MPKIFSAAGGMPATIIMSKVTRLNEVSITPPAFFIPVAYLLCSLLHQNQLQSIHNLLPSEDLLKYHLAIIHANPTELSRKCAALPSWPHSSPQQVWHQQHQDSFLATRTVPITASPSRSSYLPDWNPTKLSSPCLLKLTNILSATAIMVAQCQSSWYKMTQRPADWTLTQSNVEHIRTLRESSRGVLYLMQPDRHSSRRIWRRYRAFCVTL